MKSEWHRYNLKRRIVNLNPISNNEFLHKVANNKEVEQYDEFGFLIETKKLKKGKKVKNSLRYDLLNRGRNINNINTNITRDSSPTNSINSNISNYSLATFKTDTDFDGNLTDTTRDVLTDYNTEEETDIDIDTSSIIEINEPLLITQCIYCSFNSSTIDDNLFHMLNNHGLYIPEREFLTNIEGLIRYLSDLVVIDKECIKCGFISNKLIGIRQHIKSKGHACIPYEDSYNREFFSQFYTFNEEEEEMEDDKDITAIIDKTGVELSLSNGNKLGHRSMIKYYKQKLPNERKLSDGEMTISIINKENEKLKHYSNVLKHNKEIKEISIINKKLQNREFSTNSLRYKNNLKYYQNQKFG